MKACGIVAEYNPFHNGHAYQIEQIRKKLQPDVVIAVMSGNFLQRGEPAFIDKWTRTQMALAGGVDLVVELPVQFSTQAADYFAKGALEVFSQLELDALSFGVEEGSAADFLKGAQWLVAHEKEVAAAVKQSAAFNAPYAQQVEEVITKLAPHFPLHLTTPNNQLGFAYVKEIVRRSLDKQIEIFPLPRKSAAYHEQELSEQGNIASATAIRRAAFQGKDIRPYIPTASYPYLEAAQEQLVTWTDYFPYLQYQLTVQSEKNLRHIYQMNEGLEQRLKANIQTSASFAEFMQKIKTKRYTQTSLQRLLTYTLLQWPRREIKQALTETPAVRVLGFTQKGQEYLSQQKKKIKTKLITNVNQKNAEDLTFDIAAGEIYRLGKRSFISKQDFTRKPIKID